MNRYKLKTTILLSIVLLLGCFICGCSKVESNVKENIEINKIVFSWWGNDPRHLYTMEGVDEFMMENPDVRVEYKYGIWNGYETRNRVFMKSHTEPDVMQINYGWLSQYSPNGEGYYDLYELTDYIDLSGYNEMDLNFGTVNGKLNALPIAYNSVVTYYNKDIYDKYGLDIPETWDDLFEAARAMRKDGIYPIGGVKKHVFMLLSAYYEQTKGESVFDENGVCQLDIDEMAYILDFYKRLIDEKVLIPIDQFDRNLLSTGELAGAIFWISDIDNYCSSIAETGTPSLGKYLTNKPGDTVTGWYKKPATMYAISVGSEHPDAAARLLNYLVNDPKMAVLQATEKGIPVSIHAIKAIEDAGLLEGYSVDANNQMVEAGDSLTIMIPAMEDDSIIDIFKTNADSYIYEKVTLEEAAQKILDGVNTCRR